MKKFFAILSTLALAGLILAACTAAPGEREFKAGLREYKRGQYVRAKAFFEKSIQARPASDANAAATDASSRQRRMAR